MTRQPVVALIGRPNVGKSTLFNRLTRSRQALVANVPGLTRDRQYGDATVGELPITLVDTGGLDVGQEQTPTVEHEMAQQSLVALREADVAVLVTDGRAGPLPGDHQIAKLLRRQELAVIVLVNKTDGIDADGARNEFHGLGLGDPLAVSATHGRGMGRFAERLAEVIRDRGAGSGGDIDELADGAQRDDPDRISVSIVGRPNVGKSTLVNRILGDERVVVFDQPGTTRDAVAIPFERAGRDFTLVDTAGVRRRGRVEDTVEKFSLIKALEAIRAARVTFLVVDAREGLVEQDLHLLGYAINAGRSIALLVNKWDGLARDQRDALRKELDRRLVFAPWVVQKFISALHGSGVGGLTTLAAELYEAGRTTGTTSELSRVLEQAVERHPPPLVHGHRIKLRMAHPGGQWPPTVVIHGNQTESLPRAWLRYIEGVFRDHLGLQGTPVRIELRTSQNPFAGRRNELTERQKRRRKRVIRHRRR